MIDIDALEALAKAAPSGKWEVWTSNSWRRVYANQGREKVCVVEPTTQHDRWADLMFGPGVPEYLEGVTPETVLALVAELRALREDKARLDYLDKMNSALNAHYGTTYNWQLIKSPNITRLMSGRQWAGYVGDIDLNDAQCGEGTFDSCRKAIDAARGAK